MHNSLYKLSITGLNIGKPSFECLTVQKVINTERSGICHFRNPATQPEVEDVKLDLKLFKTSILLLK